MKTTNPRKAGPTIDAGPSVVGTTSRPRYSMAELLAASDYSKPEPGGERDWIDAPAVGKEPL